MTVLVCGSRNWSSYDRVLEIITVHHEIKPITKIIQGGARGADSHAGTAAIKLGIPFQTFPAEWKKYGLSAGYRRNKEMVDSKPDLVLAFQRNKSRGTQHTIDLARAAGIPVEVYTE